jgi:thermitase
MTKSAKSRLFAGTAILLLCGFRFLVGTGARGDDDRLKRPLGRSERSSRQTQRLSAMSMTGTKPAGYASDKILLRFKPAMSVAAAGATLRAYGSSAVASIPRIGVIKARVPAGATVTGFITALNRNPDVEYAEPDYRTSIHVTPDDEYFWRQYALYNDGENNGVPGSPEPKLRADIKATAAWEVTKGSSSVIIGILDTGIDMTHPDIVNKIVSPGRDFVNGDDDATDDHWHGTHVAGIAAAETDNSQGIAGVAWNCRVLPVKIVNADGEGSYSAMIDGIIYAVDQGVQVINLSVGGTEASEALREALQYAHDNNVVVVASAGNEASAVCYPAAYDDYCLAVAATTSADERADFSNFGPQVDVAAPGVDVLSLIPTWYFGSEYPPYAFAGGTSMAAPHVAGFAALVISAKPWLGVDEIMNIIRYSADDVNSATLAGRDDELGYGRINMERALVPYELKTAEVSGVR